MSRIVVDIHVREVDDEKELTVNETKLHLEGVGDYLTTAQRVISAAKPVEAPCRHDGRRYQTSHMGENCTHCAQCNACLT